MEILHYPDPKLTATNKALGEWSTEAASKVAEMRRLLAQVRGAGLAAPQVGWNVKLFILSIPSKEGESRERIIFDPIMTPIGPKAPMNEGCLSFPFIFATIYRYESVRLVGKTPEGSIDEVVTGFEAQAVQHEMDHLDGILFSEKMMAADRKINAPLIQKLEEDWKRRRKE
jgi:peptide deformylase